jgi:hypothetical protein
MLGPLAKFIDWYGLQFWWAVQLKSIRKWNIRAEKSKLREALEFLNRPDFVPTKSSATRVEFNPGKPGLHFKFPTPRPCDIEANNVVYGRLYRCAGMVEGRSSCG